MITKQFKELSSSTVDTAGGKGASLGEMYNANIPVPNGFVILSNAFNEFISRTGLITEIEGELDKVDIDNVETVERASENIQSMIFLKKFPEEFKESIFNEFKELNTEFVAVRSSATSEDSADAAWAGQLDTFLNTTEKDLLENIKKCWASLFTPRAIFYRFEKGLEKIKVSVAVVVQKMIASELSGIAFSVHPITEDSNQLLIEAGKGLGEAIVSGQITPDNYVVKKDTLEIESKYISEQNKALYRGEKGGVTWIEKEEHEQKLSDELIIELSKIINQIEDHYGFPCDIEWAYAEEQIYITQSRPITTLSNTIKEKPELKKRNENKPIILSKYMSREHSLFYASVWNVSNRDILSKHIPNINIKNMIFNLNNLGILEVYYDLIELEKLLERIAQAMLDKKELIDEVIEQFYYYWKKLKPYIDKEKEITNLKELEEYYTNWIEWWAPMAILFIVPDRENLPKNIREKAFKVREETQEYSDDGDRVYQEFMNKNYPQLQGLSTYLLPEEIFNLEKLTENDLKNIQQRKQGYALITSKGKTINTLYETYHQTLEQENLTLEKIEITNNKKITGEKASKGIAKGKIKLILKKEDLKNIKDRDVMVTYATSPDYVPAMKKAAAIITDEGGLVCHAAIVSRELGIPCIVGTKIATQVLKDGDLVEVDANKGIVTILEKQN